MKKARPAFTKRDDLNIQRCREGKELIECEKIGCHMIFDVKMDGSFTRKARFVAAGVETDPPSHLTYSSVVSRESVRIAFLVAALNDLQIRCADCFNAHHNAKCREKI